MPLNIEGATFSDFTGTHNEERYIYTNLLATLFYLVLTEVCEIGIDGINSTMVWMLTIYQRPMC